MNIPVNLELNRPVSLMKTKHVVAISSGKGGVGKSTVAANLAVALARQGKKVGLLDADIYGPSIPKMFGVEDFHPYMVESGGKELIEPAEQFGVRILSIGFFIDSESAAVWRGPMASGAMKQLIEEGHWGTLDYFLIDLPPGTSDIHLTLVQTVGLSGAVVVSTPQEVALADAVKGIRMFQDPDINVPVLGLVENMAWFTPERHPDERYYLFGREGVKNLADQEGLTLLAQIPVVQDIMEAGDAGEPVAMREGHPATAAFDALAIALEEELSRPSHRDAKPVKTTK